jgi:RNA polymerase sigma-70 factor (ECF subfamily)
MTDIAAILALSRQGKSPTEIAALRLTSWQHVQEVVDSHRLPRAVARKRPAARRPVPLNGVSSLTLAGPAPASAVPVLSTREDFGAACIVYWPALRRYALALTRDRDRDRAEDLVQDTFERALRKRALFRDGTDLCSWLIHMLHNIHCSGLRSVRRRGGVALDVTALGRDNLHAIALPATQLRVLEARDGLARFAQLRRHHRDAIRLAVDGVPYERIALLLGIPFGTVKSRLCRGRARLRAAIDGSIRGARPA